MAEAIAGRPLPYALLQRLAGAAEMRRMDRHAIEELGLPVRLEPMGGQTTTDSDGIFKFIGVSTGQHQLLIEDPRYYTKALTVKLKPSETRNLGIVNVFRRAGVEKAALSLGGAAAR